MSVDGIIERDMSTETQFLLTLESQTATLKPLSRGLTDCTTPRKDTSSPSLTEEMFAMEIGDGWIAPAPSESTINPNMATVIAPESKAFLRAHSINPDAMWTYRQAF
jgi:hypothetical protein